MEDNLKFERFSVFKSSHMKLVREFSVDTEINEYFEDWELLLQASIKKEEDVFAYIAKLDDEIIGLLVLNYFSEDQVIISQGILSQYRGNNYANKIREAVIESLKENGVKQVVGYIRNDNDSVIKNMIKNNYSFCPVPGTNLSEVRYLDLNNNIKR